MKHQVKGQILDPGNFSTKTGVGNRREKTVTVTEMWEDRNNSNLKAVYLKEQPNYFEQLKIEN